MIEKIYKNHIKRKKERELLQKKFDSLSIQDKNAYEQIIDRNTRDPTNAFGETIYATFKLIFLIGIFFIILSIIFDIPISNFRQGYLSLIGIVPTIIFILFILTIIGIFIDSNRLNRIKRRLLLGK